MSEPPVKFRVLIVESSEKFGVLLERTETTAEVHYAYFYPDMVEGLLPTTKIFQICGTNHYKLDQRNCQHQILQELRNHAKEVTAKSNSRGVISITQRYPEDYSQAMHHAFKRSKSDLMKFIGSYKIYREKILVKKRGENKLVGKAASFQVCDPEHIPRDFLPPPEGKTWYELYLGALVAPEDLPKNRIELKTKIVSQEIEGRIHDKQPVTSPSLRAERRDRTLTSNDVTHKYHRVLLTGGPGSGKTTMLKLLVEEVVESQTDSQQKPDIPVFVQLKQLRYSESHTLEQLIVNVVLETIAGWSKSELEKAATRVGASYPVSKKHSLEILKSEIEDWLLSPNATGPQNVLLLLDGFNEVPPYHRPQVEEAIEKLFRHQWHIVISSREYGYSARFPSLMHLQIQDLSDGQVIVYLDQCLNGKGEDIFYHRIAGDPRRMQMARNPFCLSLIADYLQTNPEAYPPVCEGKLLEFAIKQHCARKHREHLHLPDIPEPDLNRFLATTAYRMIDLDLAGLVYPDQVEDLQPELKTRKEMLRYAELTGILDKSGFYGKAPMGTGLISFSHDLFRDYFAALEMRKRGIVTNQTSLEWHLDSKKWDVAFRMLFGLMNTDSEFNSGIQNVMNICPAFAPILLLSYPSATESHAEKLLSWFPMDKDWIFKIPFRLVPYNDNIPSALCYTLSMFSDKRLKTLYFAPDTNAIIRVAIPRVFVLKFGEGSIEKLKELALFEGRDVSGAIIDAVASLRTPDSYEFLVECYSGDFSLLSFINAAKALENGSCSPSIEQVEGKIAEIYKKKEGLEGDDDGSIIKLFGPPQPLTEKLDGKKKPLIDPTKVGELKPLRRGFYIEQGENLIYTQSWVVTAPLRDARTRDADIERLVKLTYHENDALANAAWCRLLSLDYPDAIEILIKSYKNSQTAKVKHRKSQQVVTDNDKWEYTKYYETYWMLSDDLVALARAGRPEADGCFLQCFDEWLRHGASPYSIPKIAEVLIQNGERELFSEVLTRLIESDSSSAIVLLSECAEYAPQLTNRSLKSLPMHKEEQFRHNRIILVRGLCGDREVTDDLLRILKMGFGTVWSPHVPGRKLDDIKEVCISRLCLALLNTSAFAAIEMLDRMQRSLKSDLVRQFAFVCLVGLSIKNPRTDYRGIRHLVGEIVRVTQKSHAWFLHEWLISVLSDTLQWCSDEIAETFFREMLERIKKAVAKGETERARVLYRILQPISVAHSRRFLRTFNSWPFWLKLKEEMRV